MKISEESLKEVRRIASGMDGTPFHFHTHILYDLRSHLGTGKIEYLEIGCAYGMSACLMASHPFPTNCTLVDLGIPDGIQETVEKNMEKYRFEGNNYTYIKGDSKSIKSVKEVFNASNKYDIVFIDGDHTKNGVLNDYENYSELVKVGGYLIFDDYLDEWDCPEVKLAVDEILEKYGEYYEQIGCLEYNMLKDFTDLPKNNLFIMKKILETPTRSKFNLLSDEGYVVLKDFFPKKEIHNLLESAKKIFEIQFNKRNYSGDFKENMIRLFNEDEDVFINCGKIIQQGLIELYQISVDPRLIKELKDLGISFPNLCTRPVLFFNHPKLAKEEVYYKTPIHQDWPSMQSSSDSLVVWIPLVDVSEENGSIVIYPGSHKFGDLSNSVEGGFAKINEFDSSRFKEVQPSLKVGDIAIFSTFLVHKSGDIKDDSIRWSCHFRFTNMLDQDFIDRGFPNPYLYKPLIKEN